MTTIIEIRQRKQEQHRQRLQTIVTEILNGNYMKGFYEETISEQGKDLFGDGHTTGGIGDGCYYPTLRHMIEDALNQLMCGEWDAIREHTGLHKYIQELVKDGLETEVWSIRNIEDLIEHSWGGYVVEISVSLDDIVHDISGELIETLTDELVKKFGEDNSPSK